MNSTFKNLSYTFLCFVLNQTAQMFTFSFVINFNGTAVNWLVK